MNKAQEGTVYFGPPGIRIAGAALHRRSLLQSMSAIALSPAFPDMALAAELPAAATARTTRPIRADHRFLLFPINNEARQRRVRVIKDGRVLRSFTASLGLPAHWWAHLDASAWQGETLTLSVEDDLKPGPGARPEGRGAEETDNAALAGAVRTSKEIWSPETVYKEPLRPLFHFSARRGWINDPNGLMYYNGRYHMFFQHNPYGIRWGNLHWGHAVSTDLVHWQELPIALYPRSEDDQAFSGSGVIDGENTSGWGRNGKAPMVIAFTSSGRGECIAYSRDEGRTWTEFEGNPVVKHEGRDPKLLWHAPTRQWVMAVYTPRPGVDPIGPKREGIAFYTSPNLKTWQARSWIEGYFECPDVFALPVDGKADDVRWVLTGASGYYAIGRFDGSHFIPESPRLPSFAGGGPKPAKEATYSSFAGQLMAAAQIFNNDPSGEVVQIAWSIVDIENEPFRHIMNFPTVLSLRTTMDGVRLCREPVDAIRSLRAASAEIPKGQIKATPASVGIESEAWDVEVVIKLGTSSPIVFDIGGDEYIYRPNPQLLVGPNGALPIPAGDGRLVMRILVDRTTVEVFGDRGQAYGMFIRTKPGGKATLSVRTGKAHVEELLIEKFTAHALRSSWTASIPVTLANVPRPCRARARAADHG